MPAPGNGLPGGLAPSGTAPGFGGTTCCVAGGGSATCGFGPPPGGPIAPGRGLTAPGGSVPGATAPGTTAPGGIRIAFGATAGGNAGPIAATGLPPGAARGGDHGVDQ